MNRETNPEALRFPATLSLPEAGHEPTQQSSRRLVPLRRLAVAFCVAGLAIAPLPLSASPMSGQASRADEVKASEDLAARWTPWVHEWLDALRGAWFGPMRLVESIAMDSTGNEGAPGTTPPGAGGQASLDGGDDPTEPGPDIEPNG